MSELASRGSVDPLVVQAAQDAVRSSPERDPEGDFRAILADVRRRMRYTHDPLNAEVVKAPRYVIERTNWSRHPEPMDCDDATTLAGAMLGAIGYQTKFVTVAVDRARPSEWSHVYLAVRHPDGRWIALDPIVREFDIGDEVPAGQLTAPRAYHQGVDPMSGSLGCDPRMSGVGSRPAGLGYAARGMGETAAPAEAPWYNQLFATVGGFFNAQSEAAKAKAATDIANAQAKIAKFGQPRNPETFFRNADGSIKTGNVAIAAVAGGLAIFAITKAMKRR